jgi:hypothetical protein
VSVWLQYRSDCEGVSNMYLIKDIFLLTWPST